MRSWTIAFLIGVLFLQYFTQLPNEKWVWWIVASSIFIRILLSQYWQYLRLPIAIMLGFAWCLWYASAQLAWRLPPEIEGKPIIIKGYIASIPDASFQDTSFLFSLKKIQLKKTDQTANGLVQLTWRAHDLHLKVGDEWQLSVILKKAYGTLNPGGFDYEAYAFQEGIKANGSVLLQDNHLLSRHWYHGTLNRIRQYFKEKIATHLKSTNTSPWIIALAVGERRHIDEKNWEVLRNTGTNHLMAIAGLHIGLMAAFIHFMVMTIWRRFSVLTQKIPAQQVGAIAGLFMALLYSAMAGFSIPTQRACFMLTIFMSTVLLRRHIAAWQAWSYALLCVLLVNPLSVLTESFCLSFGSVALILYGTGGRLRPQGLWWKWGRIQWVIAIGLLPLSIGLFHQFSLVSFIANSIAIPCVGFIIVPCTLLGCFLLPLSSHAGSFMLCLADKLLSMVWMILTDLAHLPGVVWYQMVPSPWILLAAIIGIIFLLAPIGLPGRYLGIVWILPLILFKPIFPKSGEVWLNLLDVGQGLSVVIQTQNHILVYDAGARLSASHDMGERVVIPFLQSIHAKKIDMLVISHGDNDHIGGAPAILNQFPVLSIKTSVPAKLPKAEYCLKNLSWQWDGVNFKFLHPAPNQLDRDNNSSCVLRISNGKHHILLTGDIEKLAEKELVDSSLAELQADILIAPHHGSKTSALDSFVTGVQPQFVLFSVGYRNRYHFPHQSVVMAYHDLAVTCYETAYTGAIQFRLGQNDRLTLPSLYRQEQQHYWNNPIKL